MAGAGDWATDDFKTLLAGFGGDGHLVNDKFEPPSTSPEGVKALYLYADLINNKKVTPPGTTSASWDNVATSFSDGLTAMTMNYHDLSLSPNVKGSVAYAVDSHGQVHRAAFRHLDAVGQFLLEEQGMGLPRDPVVHQRRRPRPKRSPTNCTRPAPPSTKLRPRILRSARNSATSTRSWASRLRLASDGRA